MHSDLLTKHTNWLTDLICFVVRNKKNDGNQIFISIAISLSLLLNCNNFDSKALQQIPIKMQIIIDSIWQNENIHFVFQNQTNWKQNHSINCWRCVWKKRNVCAQNKTKVSRLKEKWTKHFVSSICFLQFSYFNSVFHSFRVFFHFLFVNIKKSVMMRMTTTWIKIWNLEK